MNIDFKSIKVKYVFIGLIIVLISLIIIASFSYVVSHDIVSRLSDRWINEAVTRNSNTIDNWFVNNRDMIDTIVYDIELSGDFSYNNLQNIINNKMKIYKKDALDFYIGFESERKLISGVGWEAPDDYDARKRSWYIRAKNNKGVIFTEPYVDAMTGEMIITVAKSIYDNNRLVGVLAKDIYLTDVVNIVNEIKVNEQSYGMLLDNKGRIIVHPNDEFLPDQEGIKGVSEINWSGYQKVVKAIKNAENNNKIEITSYEGNKELIYYNEIATTGWHYATAVSQASYEKPMSNLVNGFGWALLFSIIIALLIMYKLIQSIVKPIESLNNTVESFSTNNMDVRSSILTEDEIGKLGKSFNEMADTIQDYSNDLENKVEEKTKKLRLKNKTIMESIEYASKIQNSIIPDLNECLDLQVKDYFSIWKPRDKVGGDIYWCKTIGNYTLIAIIDCTGHGVPGAFMSMMVNSILNSVTKVIKLNNPAKILQEVDIRLKESLGEYSINNKNMPKINDGADIGLISIDNERNKLIFSGAKIDIFISDKNDVNIIRGSKRSIGYSLCKEDFKNIEFDRKADTQVYISTDGFLDQNSKSTKYGIGKKGFIKLLNDIKDQGMKEQMIIIEKIINEKLKSTEQRDDITLIGMKL